jgi:hypothetical protein
VPSNRTYGNGRKGRKFKGKVIICEYIPGKRKGFGIEAYMLYNRFKYPLNMSTL